VGELYGPDLLASQQELIEAKRAVRRAERGSPALRSAARATLDAARERFRLWGFTPEQIRTLERQGQANDHMTIYSPIAGVVIEKAVDEGSYVGEGDAIVRIADLSKLWLVMPAYESDLRWLRYGQRVAFEVAALPGERFEGRIAFVSPVLDPATRTAEVRVNLDNAGARFKPEMFARARVQVHVRDDGQVVEPSLEGKWLGPMHPEIVSDEPGVCPICGMELVPAETLGFGASGRPPLVIPVTAPLITGERAIVYVAHFGPRHTRYEGREVLLGPRAGKDYVVLQGLREGERVVTRGAFKIDSSLQIRAEPSMMNPEGSGSHAGHAHTSEEP
jgi:Cu(I)/Ag(I) efflux system membrane fusion protein